MPQVSLLRASALAASPFTRRSRNRVAVWLVAAAAMVGVLPTMHAQTASAGGFVQVTSATPASPFGIAVDGNGNVYTTTLQGATVYKGIIVNGTYTGTAILTGLNAASGIAVDASGNLFLSTPAGVVKETLQAGGTYVASTISSFSGESLGVTLDTAGNVYYTQLANLYKLTYSGGTYSAAVKINTTAYGESVGVTVDSSGNLYVADYSTSKIYQYTPNGASYTESVLTTGVTNPEGVSKDAFGNFYITCQNGGLIKATPSGATFTYTTVNSMSGNGETTTDPGGRIYAAIGSYIDEVFGVSGGVPATPVATAAAQTPVIFTIGTAGTLPALSNANVLTQGASGLDFTLGTGSTCTGAVTAGQGCTVNVAFTPKFPGQRLGAVNLYNAAGSSIIATAYISGLGTGPKLNYSTPAAVNVVTSGLTAPQHAIADPAGNVYIANGANVARALAGSTTATVYATSASFGGVVELALDGAGTLYATDYVAGKVFKIVGTTVTPLVASTFTHPQGIVTDGAGDVFFVDQGANIVYEVEAGATTATTIIPSSGGLSGPTALAIDAAGNLFVSDVSHNLIKKIAAGATTTTTVTTPGFTLSGPEGLAVDAAGNLFINDLGNSRILEVPASGSSPFVVATVNGQFFLSIDSAGKLYLASFTANAVIGFNRTTIPTLSFANTAVGATSASQTLTLENDGNTALTVPIPGSGQNPSLSKYFTQSGSSTCPLVYSTSGSAGTLAAGTTCTEILSFSPTMPGAVTGGLVFTDNNLNVAGATQSIKAIGTTATVLTVTAVSQNAIVATASVTLEFTVGYGGNIAPTATPTLTVAGSSSGVGTISCTPKAGHNVCFAPYNTSALARGTYTILATQPADGTYAAASGTAILTITNAAGQSSVSPVQTLSVKTPVILQAQPVLQRSVPASGAAVVMSAAADTSFATVEDLGTSDSDVSTVDTAVKPKARKQN